VKVTKIQLKRFAGSGGKTDENKFIGIDTNKNTIRGWRFIYECF
jgi:hypothetical protein